MGRHVLKISTTSNQNANTNTSNTLRLLIECLTERWTGEWSDSCGPEAYANIEWYLERYAEHEPFAEGRAIQARETLGIYAKQLAAGLRLDKCPKDVIAEELEVRIHLDCGSSLAIFAPLWECLEDPLLWPSQLRPSSVVVKRSIKPNVNDVGELQSIMKDDINVLIVCARPQFHEDIPQRLVSRVVIGAAVRSNGPVSVEIVRPGSLAAFEDHLESKPRRYYDLAHFDLHGSEHHSKPYLDFLKTSAHGFTSDPIEATSIAQILLRHGVTDVVINACRSGYSANMSTSLAATLVMHGVSSVVAMAYQIPSNSVKVFTKAFYECIFSFNKTSFAVATAMGRRAIREHDKQMTNFGFPVSVQNAIVPVFDENEMHPSRKLSLHSASDAPGDEFLAELSSALEDLQGRESDILLLEHSLLLESNIGLLSGRPGVGKTALLLFLARWWRMTNLVENAFWITPETLGSGDVRACLQKELTSTLEDLDTWDPWSRFKLPWSLFCCQTSPLPTGSF